MEEKRNGVSVTITINDGNTTIAPVAEVASMTINYNGVTDSRQPELYAAKTPQMSETVKKAVTDANVVKLRKYVGSAERVEDYVEELRQCESATDLAMVVVRMFRNEKDLLEYEIKKERFIKIVTSLAPGVKTGNTVSNIRARIKEQLELL